MFRKCKRRAFIPVSQAKGKRRSGWEPGFFLLLLLVMAGCAAAPVSESTAPQALAVWPLEDLSLPGTVQPDLADLLTAKVMETVEAAGSHPLVERERLLGLLQELNLGSGELADESTGLRIGRLVGARLMMFGSYQVVAMQMRIDLRMVDVETGKVVRAAERIVSAGDLAGWLNGAAAATRDLLAQ